MVVYYADYGKFHCFDDGRCATTQTEAQPEGLRVTDFVRRERGKENYCTVLFEPQGVGEYCTIKARSYEYWGKTLIRCEEWTFKAYDGWRVAPVQLFCVSDGINFSKANMRVGRWQDCGVYGQISWKDAVSGNDWQELKMLTGFSGLDGLAVDEVDVTERYLNERRDWCPVSYEVERANGHEALCRVWGRRGETWLADEATMRQYRREALL